MHRQTQFRFIVFVFQSFAFDLPFPFQVIPLHANPAPCVASPCFKSSPLFLSFLSEDLDTLVSACHERDMWVMLDVVANHVGVTPNRTSAGDMDFSQVWKTDRRAKIWGQRDHTEWEKGKAVSGT